MKKINPYNPYIFFHKVQSQHFIKKIRTKKNKNRKLNWHFKKITDSYDIDIFYANFVQSKKLVIFYQSYIPQLAFSSKVFDVNLVKKNDKVTKKNYET